MSPFTKAAILSCVLLSPATATAQVTLGVRAGLALPLGDLEDGTPAKERLDFAYPIEGAIGWRLSPSLEVGVQGGYAFTSVGGDWSKECAVSGRECRAHLWNLAARGEYAVKAGDFLPFVAATLGWEWEVERWEVSADDWEQTRRNGWLGGLEAGAYAPVTKTLELGAYVGASFGQLRSATVKGEIAGYAYTDSGAIPSPAVHGWLSIGLRGRFTL
ncbi:MAG TPA: hypothetical protein VLT61_03720 [Anaeromyxobacteraceae bacterium]|nr:hypothetical protein [Anaeromyxobacteraceae bacterium]